MKRRLGGRSKPRIWAMLISLGVHERICILQGPRDFHLLVNQDLYNLGTSGWRDSILTNLNQESLHEKREVAT